MRNEDLNIVSESNDDSDTVVENECSKNFKHLYSFLDKVDCANPIDTPVNKNIGEVLLMLFKYALTNALSLTAIVSLFGLINCIFVEPIPPESRYFIDKLFNPSHCTTYHGLCTRCRNNIGTFTRSDSSKRCEISIAQLNQANQLLHEFVYDTQRLYSKLAMKFNIHILLHLAPCVLN